MKRRREELYQHDIFDLPPSLSICPVCGSSVSKENIGLHVEQHFISSNVNTVASPKGFEAPSFHPDTPEFQICSRPDCQEIVSTTEWEDHLFAHSIEDTQPSCQQASNTQDDSLLALELHRQEQDQLFVEGGVGSSGDNVLSLDLEQHEMDRLENQPCEWNDHLLAQALQSEEQRSLEEQRIKEEEEFVQLQALYGMGPSTTGGYAAPYTQSLEQEVTRNKASVGDYYARKAEMLKILMTDNDSGESCTKGVIAQLVQRYEMGVNGTKSAWLCADTYHFASTVGDAGWGCGYRNLQMLISSALRVDVYKQTVYNAIGENIPSIPKIQQLIEAAWNAGFDKQGAEQLGGKLVNSRKWIGATEISAVLRSFGLRARLIDFHQATGSDGTHPEMFAWIRSYFSGTTAAKPPGTQASPIQQTKQPPLYLQHQGHSRLVVGVEEHAGKDGGVYLLLFDPSHSAKQMQSLLDDIQSSSSGLRHLRRSLKQMRCKQYQICYIAGVMEPHEIEQSKIIDSLRVP